MNTESMPLFAALAQRRNDFIRLWFDRLVQSYPEPTVRLLSHEKDPFHNPVGHTLRKGLADLFDGLLQQKETASLTPPLDAIVRMRAVQDFTAEQAVAFPFLLKQIIRKEFAADTPQHFKELAILEARIDELILLAFDLFMKCREQIYESKVNEIKRRSFILDKACQK